MKKQRIWFYFFLLIAIAAFTLLISGSVILTMNLDSKNTIPLGTFTTWAGIIALPLSVYLGVKKFRKPTKQLYKYLSLILKVAIAFALFWMPICYLLAGNLSFSFSEKATFQGGQVAMKCFWFFSYSVVLLPVIVLAIHLITSIAKRKNNKH